MYVLRTPRTLSHPFSCLANERNSRMGDAEEGWGECEAEAIELSERGNTFVCKMKKKQCKIIHMH